MRFIMYACITHVALKKSRQNIMKLFYKVVCHV